MVKKEWFGGNGSELSESEKKELSATVALKRRVQELDGYTVRVTVKSRDNGTYNKTDTYSVKPNTPFTLTAISWGGSAVYNGMTYNAGDADGKITIPVNVTGNMDVLVEASAWTPAQFIATYTSPESYKEAVEDSSFSKSAVLDYKNDWYHLWDDLEKTDDSGAKYSYYVKEISIPDGFTVTYSNNDGIQSGTITVKNTKNEQKGALKFTKKVTVNGAEIPTTATETQKKAADGTYIFTVQSGTGVTPTVTKYVGITVTGGKAVSYKIADTEEGLDDALEVEGEWAIISNLAAGDYTITETDPTNGTTLSSIERGDQSSTSGDSGSQSSGDDTQAAADDETQSPVDLDNNKVTVHVTAGDTTAAQDDAQATFTNDLVTASLKLKKQVTINDFDPTHSTVTDKTLADGTYTINIVGKENTPTAGKSYTVKITITNGAAASATIRDNTVPNPVDTGIELTDGSLTIPDLIPGTYVLTEEENTKTVLSSVESKKEGFVADLDNRRITVIVSGSDIEAQLVTFTNNYVDNSETDIAHISVRKTFKGLKQGQDLPENFKITVKVTANIDGQSVVKDYTLTGETVTSNGVIWKQTENDDGDIVWDWRISIQGLTTEANVEIQEISYDKQGYTVTTSVNPANPEGDGTSYTGTVSGSTTIASVSTDVYTPNNQSTFPVYDQVTSSKIFIARLTDDQTALVISKNKLNLSERLAIEKQLKDNMSKGGDWTHGGHQVLYYSFEDAATNQIVVKGYTVTYSEENGGQITFGGECQWTMVAEASVTYQEGRPADVNFENTYTPEDVDVDVIKVEQGSSNPVKYLSGATFQLRQIADKVPTGNGTYESEPGTQPQTKPTEGEAGKLTFSGLVHGYYELTETIAPAGYVLTGDTTVYFKVDENGVTRLQKGNGKPSEWTAITSSAMVTFEAAKVDNPATTDVDESANASFTIGNTPGNQLPQTGGIGTTLFTALGGLITVTAGAILTMRRGKRKPMEG